MPRRRKNVGKIKNFSHKMQAKLVVVFCVVMLLFLALMGRLLYLNYTKGSTYAKRVYAQQTYVSSVIPYRRGNITDRKGTLFATSEKVYNLIFEPKTILLKENYYKEPTLSALISIFGF
ncbi:MAG: peptidoglycan glycosyltransferase, partial [Lachnospiraceae bacterium]|nr:peptidoglycan glycosyltransferase [Lachnospiraceae bacterium]